MFGAPTAPTKATNHSSTCNETKSSSPMQSHHGRLSIANLLTTNGNTAAEVEKFEQFGRQYYRYRGELVYPFPIDEVEKERLDIFHALIYTNALRGKLHTVSLCEPQETANVRLRVLDVGFGTGFWIADMAGEYPSSEIIGLDLDTHPGTERSNCRFLTPVDFTAPSWPIDEASLDLIHMAQLCGSVPDWQALYHTAYRYLRPGVGQIETIEVDWTPRSAQGQGQASSGAADLVNWWNYMQEASRQAGRAMLYREDTEQLLERTGFVDISHKRVRVPLYKHGINDKSMWYLAHSWQTAMAHLGSQSFTGLSMALFTTYLKMEPAMAEEICKRTLEVVQRETLPLYIDLHVWSARRPGR